MEPRLKYPKISPDVFRAMAALDPLLRQSGLEVALLDLVKVRVSMINECAYCIDMHWKDARAAGMSEERLYGLNSWRETPIYSERERAALAWADSVTRLADGHVPDCVFEAVGPHFSEKELVDLTWVIATMNAWNRMGIAMHAVPGRYKSPVSGSDHR